MASKLAKKAAGTFVEDPAVGKLPDTLAWVTYEARQGSLRRVVQQFCAQQPEPLDAQLVIVEQLAAECIHLRIPCRCADHESHSTFPMEVKFRLNARTKVCSRD